jgi:hypothetical protein
VRTHSFLRGRVALMLACGHRGANVAQLIRAEWSRVPALA